MEALTRLVSESLARHGFDRPLDYRRLQWSRWFRCESTHSLLLVPSKPGVFALAEEIVHASAPETTHVGADAFVRPATLSEAKGSVRAEQPLSEVLSDAKEAVEERPFNTASQTDTSVNEPLFKAPSHSGATVEERPFRAALASREDSGAFAPARRMLAVSQFFETDDMAFVLDRMLSHHNPMRARLASGRYFVRYVVIEDQSQRRSICSALNQWIVSSTEKATGIGSHFATSLELTPQTEQTQGIAERSESVARTLLSATAAGATTVEGLSLSSERGKADLAANQAGPDIACPEQNKTIRPAELSEPPFVIKPAPAAPTTPLHSGAATNIHCPFPSGF